jgi:hypothetical protein
MNNDVQFDIDSASPVRAQQKKLGLAGLLVKYSRGRIADENQANYVLLAFVVLVVGISISLLLGSGGTVGHPADIKVLPAL